MDVLYIVIPAYNESENIRRTINEWYPIIEANNEKGKSRMVVIDDGSKDDTFKIICEIAKEKPLLQPLTKSNSGHGPTLLFGYQYAIENGADYIFQTDSDGQTDPSEFGKFWEIRKKYDALFGKRVARGDGKDRAFVEMVLCKILKFYYHVDIPDSNAPFRLMKANYVDEYISKLPIKYNLPNVMLTTFGVYYDRKVCFIPISFKPRQGGTNSINIKKIINIGINAVKDFKDIKSCM